MLRATSEIAVAIIVTSVSEKPNLRAKLWPACRAATMSSGLPTSTVTSSATVESDRFPQPQLAIQQRQTLFQIQRRVHIVEHQPQLDHGKRHLRLQADNHGVGAT